MAKQHFDVSNTKTPILAGAPLVPLKPTQVASETSTPFGYPLFGVVAGKVQGKPVKTNTPILQTAVTAKPLPFDFLTGFKEQICLGSKVPIHVSAGW